MLNCCWAPKPKTPQPSPSPSPPPTPPSSPTLLPPSSPSPLPPPTPQLQASTASPPSSNTPAPPIPEEFLCPISGSLMSTPVTVPTGDTFDRAYIEACKELNYIPHVIPSNARVNFLSFALIPDILLQSTIIHWCNRFSHPLPVPISQEAAHAFVKSLKAETSDNGDSDQELSCLCHQEGDADHSRTSCEANVSSNSCGFNQEPSSNHKDGSADCARISGEVTIGDNGGGHKESSSSGYQDGDPNHSGSSSEATVNQESSFSGHHDGDADNSRILSEADVRDNRAPDQEPPWSHKDGSADHLKVTGKTVNDNGGGNHETSPSEHQDSDIDFLRISCKADVSNNGDEELTSSNHQDSDADHSRVPSEVDGGDSCGGNQEPPFSNLQDPEISTKIMLHALVTQVKGVAEARISLCNENIIDEVIRMLLHSSDKEIQVDATSVIFAFTLESSNRSKIVRSEAIPCLVHVLNEGVLKARHDAAGAFYNLATEGPKYKMAISSFEAVKALIIIFSSPRVDTIGRKYAGKAVYYLTHLPDNLEILENIGAAVLLRQIAACQSNNERDIRVYAMDIMCNLAEGSKGREELMDAEVVEEMLRMMRKEEGLDKCCLAVMHKICTKCSDQFKRIAVVAGAEDVLAKEKEEWGENGRRMAREILGIILQANEEETSAITAAENSQLGISGGVEVGNSSQ